MNKIISTKRLYLREIIIDDYIHFYNLNKDKEVLKYTGDIPFANKDEAKLFLSNYLKQYSLYKMGRWAVCLKSDNTFLGWCGLKFHPKEKIVDVGYRFYKKYWNKGYATEATKASLQYGFETLKLKSIIAHVHKENTASHKVALKSGLKFIKDFIYDDKPAKLYKITIED